MAKDRYQAHRAGVFLRENALVIVAFVLAACFVAQTVDYIVRGH